MQKINNARKKREETEWYAFQERICSHFKSIGADAQTNVTLKGSRTSHDIDIVVRTKHLGEDVTWIIEAKKWKQKVNKLQVIALVEISNDLGVDRAFIISEHGFQSGCIEAATNTCVNLKTFNELITDTREYVESEIIKTYTKRLELIETRYWAHKKDIRIKYGLRDEVFTFPNRFSGHNLLLTAKMALDCANEKLYPLNLNTYSEEQVGENTAENFQQLINWLNQNLNHLDEKILNAEIKMIESGEFEPILYRRDGISALPISGLINF